VPVQPEMERERSPLVKDSAPSGRGFSRHWGLSIRWMEAAQETGSRAADPRLDEPAKLSLGMVASRQSPLPFYLAQSL
jgi:hypothetical protein